MKYYQRSARQIYNDAYKNSGSSFTYYPRLESKVLNKSDFIFNNTTSRNYYSDTSVYTDNTNLSYFNKQSKSYLHLHKQESLDLVPSKINDADNYKIRQGPQNKGFEQDSYESDSDDKDNRKRPRNRYSNKKNQISKKLNQNYTSETLGTEHNFKHLSKIKNEQHNDSKSQQKNKIPLMVLKNKDKKNPDDSDIVYIPIVFLPDGKIEQNSSVPINLYKKPSRLKTKRDISEEMLSVQNKCQKYRSVQSYNSVKEQVQKQTQTTKSIANFDCQATVKEPEVVMVYEKSYADFNMQTENETSSKDPSLKSEKQLCEIKQTEPSIDIIKNQDSTPIPFSSETNEFIKSEDMFIYPLPKGSRPTVTQPFTMKSMKVVKSKTRHKKSSREKIASPKPTNGIYRNTKASNFTVSKTQSHCESVFSNICSKWKTKMYDIMGTQDGKSIKETKPYFEAVNNLKPDVKQFKPKVYVDSFNNFQSEIKHVKPKLLLESVPENCGKLIKNVINDNNAIVESFKKGQENDLNKNLPSKIQVLKPKGNTEKFIDNKLITLKDSIEHENTGKKDVIDLPNMEKLKPSRTIVKEDIGDYIGKEKAITKITCAETTFENELEEIIESILKGCHVILGKTIYNMVLNSIDIYAVFKEILLRELGIFKFKL